MREYHNDWYEPIKRLVDIHGRPIEKTPRSYPYNYISDWECITIPIPITNLFSIKFGYN